MTALIRGHVSAEDAGVMEWQTILADLGLFALFIAGFTLVVVRIAGRKG